MVLNFKMSELIYSDTAIKNNINNMPDINALDCLLNLLFYVLQPLRDKLKKAIIVVCAYRNYEVNRLVGGSKTSQHLKGQAADIKVTGMTQQALFDFIRKSGIEYDQLIWEQDTNCVHISFVKGKNRKETLIRNKQGKYTKLS